MPKFTREIDRPRIEPSVQGGVVDTSAASAIEGLGGAGYKLAAGAAVGELTGGAQSIDEIGTEEDAGQEELVKELGNLDNLGKIAAARKAGSISGTVANTRAKALLKKSLSDSGGMFAREIKDAFSGFFNSAIDGGGFFKDAESPYSKARSAFEEEVWSFAMAHNMGFDQALGSITARNNRDHRINQIEQTHKLDEGSVAYLTSATTVNMQENLMSRIVTSLTESGEGALNQDQSRVLKFQMDQDINNARKQFLANFEKAGKLPTPKQVEDFNNSMRTLKENVAAVIGDNELQTTLKNRAEVMSSRMNVENMKNLGNIIAVKQVYGEQMMSQIFDALNSNQVKSFYENNPLFKQAYQGMFPQGGLSQNAGSAAVNFFNPENENPTEFEKNSVVPFVQDPNIFKNTQDKLSMIISETPAAFVYFATDKWRAAVERGDYTPQDIERFMKKGIEKRKMGYLFENNSLLNSISIEQEVFGMSSIREGVPQTMRTVVKDQDGGSVGSKVYTSVLDALKVARKNPELWEGKYESADEYVTSLFSIPTKEGDPQPPKPQGANKPHSFIEGFMDDLGGREGVEAHSALESGAKVLPYGVTFTKGIEKEEGESDRGYATRIVEAHLEEVKSSVGEDSWEGLPTEVKSAVLDLKYNMGVGRGLKKAITEGGDVEEVMRQTLDTAGSSTPSGQKVTVPGLAKRRALMWNKVFPDNVITEVAMSTEGDKVEVNYIGEDGQVIFSYRTSRPISSDFKTTVDKANIGVE